MEGSDRFAGNKCNSPQRDGERNFMTERYPITTALFVLIAALILIPPAAGAGPLTADFVVDMSTGVAPFTARFTDTSVGAASWSWDFGDGLTDATANPVHYYPNPGTYTVSLTIRDSTGTQANTKTVPNLMVIMSEGGSLPPSTTTAPVTTAYTPAYTTTTVPSTTATPAIAGTIEVISVPAGAMMSLDGVEQGITPITVYRVAIGNHRVTVHSKGFLDNETSVVVENQKTSSMMTILFTKEATQSSSQTVTPAPSVSEKPTTGEQKAAAFQPTPVPVKQGYGSILFLCENCVPSQHVDLDGKIVPFTLNLTFKNLTAGTHGIHIIDPSLTCTQSQYTVEVRPGEQATLRGRACTPGFTSFLAVFAIAGIVGFRRLQR
jgi:PKD repeat protein